MRGSEHRHWLGLLAVLALAFGTTMMQGMAAAGASAKIAAVAATNDMSSSHVCDDCTGGGGERGGHGMSAAGCIALCNGSVAVLPAPDSLELGAAQRAIPRTVRSVLERDTPPDPYPPRPAVLS